MPLLDNLPVIDDRRYSDLVAEARTRIPRYAPEWTDLNDNEPGMAVVQLLAWLAEMLIYRLGQVPLLNTIKFLELLGIELTPAQPASAEVSFAVLPTWPEPTVIVPLHTQVAADVPGADTPLVFETERALIALAARLDGVQLDSGFQHTDVSTVNADARDGFAPFGSTARIGAALMLGFDSTLDFPATQLDLMIWTRPPAKGSVLFVASGAATPPPAVFAWEYWNGKEWIALDSLKDETAAFTRSGHVLLQTPAPDDVDGPLQRAVLGNFTAPRYWIRARLVSGAYQIAPMLLAARINTVAVLNAQTVDAEVLGRATGLDDQVFTLANRPVLAGTLDLAIDEGRGEEAWTEVPDFFASGPDDRHYVLDRSTGEVRFGRGARLRVPIANPNQPANVIARSYRFGGGTAGNVAAGRIADLREPVAGIDADGVVNLLAADGGADEETLDAAQTRAQQTLKSHERAVTAGDFELHALEAGGVARAKALPLYHPQFEGIAVPGVVSVIVVPQAATADPLDDPAPVPTEATLRNVCAVLDPRRLATTELYAIAPRYREVAVSAKLTVKADSDLASVKQQALALLQRYLHPLVGGEDASATENGSGWPFGGDIYYASIVQRLLLPGVRRVSDVLFTIDSEPMPPCSDVTIEPLALVKSGAHRITVQYEA
ncbi:Baseplate J-like protein [Caballeronia arationis]|jgi:predicted phage baseplate assembly protein|uniref:Putative baseplate assembly protein n=1 Tax=Caballeronia arationis TaxID=1777142 RepID=A0A7Z7I2R9_9BURK|nr:putative baseplate assembly protein [Caballeronia arationis]SAK99993.1 Baseplate J-like protein [Caballeronia arationis]SOE54430.1 putative baseplate assembly protein [Caballeronia arationis]